jgi:hypothetical protein
MTLIVIGFLRIIKFYLMNIRANVYKYKQMEEHPDSIIQNNPSTFKKTFTFSATNLHLCSTGP